MKEYIDPKDGIYYSPKHDEMIILKRVCMPMFGKFAKYDVHGRFFKFLQVEGIKIAPDEDDSVVRIGDL